MRFHQTGIQDSNWFVQTPIKRIVEFAPPTLAADILRKNHSSLSVFFPFSPRFALLLWEFVYFPVLRRVDSNQQDGDLYPIPTLVLLLS